MKTALKIIIVVIIGCAIIVALKAAYEDDQRDQSEALKESKQFCQAMDARFVQGLEELTFRKHRIVCQQPNGTRFIVYVENSIVTDTKTLPGHWNKIVTH